MIDYARDELEQLRPRMAVIGVGGAGGNAVATMIASGVEGVDFVVVNTDAQALNGSSAPTRVQLGFATTAGLGAGSRHEVGRAAAEESLPEIERMLEGANMCFIAAGMGGGTGTGAAPIIAKAARARGILTVAVVTKPFAFEGRRRAAAAEAGIAALKEHVDTLIVVPNQNLFRIADEAMSFKMAFAIADDLLMKAVRGISDLIVAPGLINLDFADIRTVMADMGKAVIGIGEASGDDRALRAAQQAVTNPLLDESIAGATGLIVSITGGETLRLMELEEAASYVKDMVDEDADIIWGSSFDPALGDGVRVAVIATGIGIAAEASRRPAAATLPAPPTVEPGIFTFAPLEPFAAGAESADPASAPEAEAAEPRPVEGAPISISISGLKSDETGPIVQGELLLASDEALRPSGLAGEQSLIRIGAPDPDPDRDDRGPSLFERMASLARRSVGRELATSGPDDYADFEERVAA